jgi:D-threo-aldose 1-dehydrogenase
MESRQIGNTPLRCSALGLGTGRLASVSSGLSVREGIRLIHAAADLGINLIDTADSYGQGDSERVIGRALKGRRSGFVVASKAGFRLSGGGWMGRMARPLLRAATRHIRAVKQSASGLRERASSLGMLKQDFTPAYIERCVENSLRRLQSDYLDIFFLHAPPLEDLINEGLLDGLEALRKKGKIRFWGVSSDNYNLISKAPRVRGLSCLQTAVNPERTGLAPALSGVAARGFGVIGNQVFSSGRLLASEGSPLLLNLRSRLAQICREFDASLQDVLLAFALSQPAVSSLLVGTTNVVHLQEAASSLSACKRISEAALGLLFSSEIPRAPGRPSSPADRAF